MRKVLYILGELEDSDLQWLVDAGDPRTINKGESVIREGGENDSLFIVISGELSVERGGRELARLGTGEVVGEMSMLDSRPPSATVSAVVDSLVFDIPQSVLHDKMSSDSGFGARFYRALCIFLANRLNRADLLVGADAKPVKEPKQLGAVSPDVLENVALAGARFDWFLQRVRGSIAT